MPRPRIAHQELLRREVAAWEDKRNRAQVRVDWQCTTTTARIKLKRLYPKLEPVNRAGADHYCTRACNDRFLRIEWQNLKWLTVLLFCLRIFMTSHTTEHGV